MTRLPETILDLIRNRRLEKVGVNVDHAQDLLRTAHQHLETARLLSTTDDHAMAFTAVYDAARKALVGVLAIHGLRVRAAKGAHFHTGHAARALAGDDVIAEFEWMRQVRNATEYPSPERPSAAKDDVREGIEAAETIIATCQAHVDDRVP